MDFDDFANPAKPLRRATYTAGVVRGCTVVEEIEEEPFPEQEDNFDYAEVYRQKENARLFDIHKNHLKMDSGQPSSTPQMEQVEDIPSCVALSDVLQNNMEEMTKIYKKFTFKHTLHDPLIVDNFKDKILAMVEVNNVVIIQGHTGCGKTTRIPQFILDESRANNRFCNIIVTQPRRIAAASVAQRVCHERAWTLGSVCGYRVGLDSCTTSDTILTYVTTGILLQKLIKNHHMNEFSHVIIDEVHERTQEMDFLLVIVRRYLHTVSRNVKVILMSATFNAEELSSYFNSVSGDKLEPAPVIYVGKQNTKYTTQVFYINQLEKLGYIPSFDVSNPRIDPSVYKLFVHLIRTFDHTDPPVNKFEKTGKIRHVLVFLPGILEIEEAFEQLHAGVNEQLYHHEDKENKIKWLMLPLHSSITKEEQRKIFDPPPEGMRKIILSTNIAESSITVPDIFYVVDFCLTKTMVADQITQYPSLQLEWATHTNCIQRAGRVGRVDNGRVYRLVTQDFYENHFKNDITPEILRAPLERLVLHSKMLQINEPPRAILALCLNPPNLVNIMNTINSLKEVGGLLRTVEGKFNHCDGDLTHLGSVMAKLPLDVRLSKLIVLGHLFGCLQQCIIMAAGLSIQNIFATPFQERLKAYKNKLLWADGSCSDLIAYLNLFLLWEKYRSDGSFREMQSERQWATKNFLNYRLLKDWGMLVDEIKRRLKSEGIQDLVGQYRFKLDSSVEPIVLKVAMCGAFYPNFFVRSCDGGQVDEKEAVKILGGRDPYTTVYLTNFDNRQPGPLYAKHIKELLKDCGTDMTVTFDKNSKVYVQFIPNNAPEEIRLADRVLCMTMPGKVTKEVYIACRKRHLKSKLILPVLKAEEAWKRAESLGITDTSEDGSFTASERYNQNSNNSIIPGLDISHIEIRVSHVNDAAHFWAQNVDIQTDQNMHTLEQLLNVGPLGEVSGKIKIGGLYAAPFSDEYTKTIGYYRAKVIGLVRSDKNREIFAKIIFVDYGNTLSVNSCELRVLPVGLATDLEPQAMECILTGVQPSFVAQRHATWSEEANTFFRKNTGDARIYGKVYSVVNGVVSLELFKIVHSRGQTTICTTSINQALIGNGYGQKSEESFLSKQNHEKRQHVQESMGAAGLNILSESTRSDYFEEVEAPDPKECRRELELRGPFSPLETNIYSLVQNGSKRCYIDGTSVNAVLLDTEPYDPHERLLVAESIGQNADGTCLTLRHTTLMPNIHGFPMLMSLLFCPKMQPKPVANGTRLAAVLCGVGSEELPDGRHRPIYPQHDIVVHTDTKLTTSMMIKINLLRHLFNEAVQLLEDISQEKQGSERFQDCQVRIHKTLMELLRIEPSSIERIHVKDSKVWGKMEFEGAILNPVSPSTGREIWQLHWTVQLDDEDEKTTKIRYNLAQLSGMSRREIDFEKISCLLCSVEFYNLTGIRVHLCSQQHQTKLLKLDILKNN